VLCYERSRLFERGGHAHRSGELVATLKRAALTRAISHTRSDFCIDYSKDDWKFGGEFCVFSHNLDLLVLHELPLSVSLIRRDKPPRTFRIDTIRFCEFVTFIEFLFFNGLAVPSTKELYSFEFFANSRTTIYPYVPFDLQIPITLPESLDSFWQSVIDVSEELIICLAADDLLSRDKSYPLSAIARAIHWRRLHVI
jgi:hypothetical protein